MEMTQEMILERIQKLTTELTSDQAEISDQDGCPLTDICTPVFDPVIHLAWESIRECLQGVLSHVHTG